MFSPWVFLIAAAIVGGALLMFGHFFSLWLTAYVTGTRIGMLSLILMSLRKVDPKTIVKCKIMAVQAGLPDFPTRSLEAQYLAGGDVERVTTALIAAHCASIHLDWDTAAAIDLAGRDVLEAVQMSVNPKIIDCPDPSAGRGKTLDGVAQDGIQLKVRVRVTVRTNISQLIGGATEATVIARVGQGIVTAIGSCRSYRDALADPMVITRQVVEGGLDAQTAFAIVSIDIADIDIGENVGARLEIDQANANIRVARAEAEKKRAMAVAHEREMVALTRENQAALILAEVQIPRAMAEAYKVGQLRGQHPSNRNAKRRTKGTAAVGSMKGLTYVSPLQRSSRELDAWDAEGTLPAPQAPPPDSTHAP